MKTTMTTIFAGLLLSGSSAFARVTLHCVPADRSVNIGWVQVSTDRSGSESLAILWTRPVGREDVEESPALAIDDFTVTGYYSEEMNAALLNYTADDFGGERDVLELDGREIPLVCKGRK